MSYVDLRVHSNASGGTLSSEQMVRLTHETGLSAIALTDHDTTAGVASAAGARTELRLEVMPDIKVSSSFRDHEIHILELFMDTDLSSLQAMLKKFRHHGNQRNQGMSGRFDAHGIHLIVEDLCAGNSSTIITRAYIARALPAKGLGPDLDHIFKRYLQCGGTYYPSKEFLSPETAMEDLLDSHAFVVLAHPFRHKLRDKATEKLITYLAGLGMRDLKVYHSSYNRLESAKLQEMAARHHLLSTGGSDLHGSNEPDTSIGTGRGGPRASLLLLDVIKNTL